jgi:pyruvate-formate lyase-activating enzyme
MIIQQLTGICNFEKKAMGHEAMKLELIEWLTQLDDEETIEYLKLVKDSSSKDEEWWINLSATQKEAIERGLNDVDLGNVMAHEDVKKKYGL